MSDLNNAQLGEKLDQLITLTALQLTTPIEKKSDKILLLGQAGMDRNLIASICDTTPHSVSVTLSAARKPGNK